MPAAILTINAGSSSTKLGLFELLQGEPKLAASGLLEGLGEKPHFTAWDRAGKILAEKSFQDPAGSHEDHLAAILDFAEHALGGDALQGAGHRIVHGGVDHIAPERVTPALLDALESLVPLAPLHQPHGLAPIRALTKLRPNLKQVACFDTAFHHTMSTLATTFAIPRDLTASGVRRYGFHGLSYEFIARRLHEMAPGLAKGRVVVAHLGSGASLCGMEDGKSIDTTMSLTALDGLVMGTRCGTIDPGVLLFLQQQRHFSVQALEDMLYHKSGLLGVSGVSADMRTLMKSTDPHAREAIDLFVFRIARETASLASTLGGLDGFVFTGGIGEHTPEIRQSVCARMAWLGATLDPVRNVKGDGLISADGSRLQVWVIPTDEELTIARHTTGLVT